ncbi:MAG TPA: hypothetical protein VFB25_02510 [Gaiellaceae bacterium]|nr:hypothetical protein [Gaiellaceae bacterium]
MRVLRQIARHEHRHSGTRPVKKVLLSFLVVGGLSCFTLAGTYATWNSESSDRGISIATGSLTLRNFVGTYPTFGPQCDSYSASNNFNSSCTAVYSASPVFYPSSSTPAPSLIDVKVTNTGTINASTFSVYMPTCSAVLNSSAPSGDGGGNPCATGGFEMTINETDSTFSLTDGNEKCVFPTTTSAGTPCTYTASTLAFMAAHKTAGSWPLSGGLASNQTRNFVIGLALPSNPANNLQGEEASFTLTWNASQ